MVVDWVRETEEQCVEVTDMVEVGDSVLDIEKEVDSVTVRDTDTQEDEEGEREEDDEMEADGVGSPVTEPAAVAEGELDSLGEGLADTLPVSDPPKKVNDMEGVVVVDVLREPLTVPESHMVMLPLGV